MRTTLYLLITFLSLHAFGQNTQNPNTLNINETYKVLPILEDADLREQPQLSSNIITTIRNGNSVKVFEEVEEFSRVEFLKKHGYILTSKITTNGAADQNKNISESSPSSTNTSTTNTNTTNKDYRSVSSTPTTKNTPKSRSTNTYRSSSYSSTCGAPTKKGGACRRKVSGGGRCWQH